jgi:hypothetical protein
MESYNEQIQKKTQESKQFDFQQKDYRIAPKRTLEEPAFRRRQQTLDPRRRRPFPEPPEPAECFNGTPGQDGAQVSCDGECHAYFA